MTEQERILIAFSQLAEYVKTLEKYSITLIITDVGLRIKTVRVCVGKRLEANKYVSYYSITCPKEPILYLLKKAVWETTDSILEQAK